MTDYREPDIERLLAAFARKKHDRTPNLEHAIKAPTLQHVMGRKPDVEGFWEAHGPAELIEMTKATGARPDMATSPRMSLPDQVELCQRTGMDAVILRRNYVGTSRRLDFGWLRDSEDLDKIEPPPPPEAAVARIRECLPLVSGTGIGIGWLSDVFLTAIYDAMGLDHFCYALADNPDFVLSLMDRFAEAAVALSETLSEQPIAFYYWQDDLAGNAGPLVSPAWLRMHWMPRVRRIVAPIRARGIPMIFHCCGKVDKVIPMAIELGFLAVNPIQPNCNDIYQIKRDYGDAVCLIGNMDIAGCLAFGSVDDVVRETQEHIDRLGADGGYVVASSHSVSEAVRPENYVAMIETAHTYYQDGLQ